jgi:hypothetical protein
VGEDESSLGDSLPGNWTMLCILENVQVLTAVKLAGLLD